MFVWLQSVRASPYDIYHRVSLQVLPEVFGTLPPPYKTHAFFLRNVALEFVIRLLHDHEFELYCLVMRAIERLMLADDSAPASLGVIVLCRVHSLLKEMQILPADGYFDVNFARTAPVR